MADCPSTSFGGFNASSQTENRTTLQADRLARVDRQPVGPERQCRLEKRLAADVSGSGSGSEILLTAVRDNVADDVRQSADCRFVSVLQRGILAPLVVPCMMFTIVNVEEITHNISSVIKGKCALLDRD